MVGSLSLLLALAAVAGETVLDARRADVREDEGGGRAVAEARACLVRDGDGIRLRVVASALGPFVDPPPGFEGVRGANAITAREMESILREGAIRARTRVRGADRAPTFRFREGRRATFPERRRLPARGGVSPPRPGREVLLAELVAESDPLGEGVHETEFLVRDVPRLVVRYVVSGGAGKILELRSGHPRDEPGRP
jgi:hypothetical protein